MRKEAEMEAIEMMLVNRARRQRSSRHTGAPRWRFASQGFAFLSAVTALAMLGGCGSSKPATIVGNPTNEPAAMPTPPAPTAANAYVGSQGPGVWNLSLNDTNNTFSYQPVTFPNSPNTPVSGIFQATNGFLNLGTANGATLGYALEIPSRLAIFRPGDTTAPLVVSVPQTSCYPLPYRLRFDFIGMQAGAATGGSTTKAYGSFVVSTDSAGADWSFQDLQGNAPFGPGAFTGACAASGGQAATALSGEGLINQYNYEDSLASFDLDFTTSYQLGPSGIFVIDQTDADLPANSNPYIHGSALVGVAQPSAALTTATVAAGSYLGFLTIAGIPPRPPQYPLAQPPTTSPVSFGATPSSGTTMNGGDFPNDDVTQSPNTDIQISFGSQDGTIYGFYPKAMVTTLDPNQYCAATYPSGLGIDANGFITCTYPAVASVGNPEGKYVVLVNTFNYTAGVNGQPMQIYLYQQ